ncbi:hypothetical protein SAMN05216534_1413 [Candidatus Aquiluna sp. UB-MaderosW2red]|nr:hypothetical protein SAMN05216534_1413 [Candidatus Aquiluna sp. UB-MaderosW2red]
MVASGLRLKPIRTCVGCRQRDSVENLMRVVLVGNTIKINQDGNLPGRGAWFHESCSQLAIDRKGFQRALGATDLVEFEAWLRNKAENMLKSR